MAFFISLSHAVRSKESSKDFLLKNVPSFAHCLLKRKFYFLVWVLDRAWKWNLGCLDSIFDFVLCLKITYWANYVSGSFSHI